MNHAGGIVDTLIRFSPPANSPGAGKYQNGSEGGLGAIKYNGHAFQPSSLIGRLVTLVVTIRGGIMQEQWKKINAMESGPELDELIARAVMDMDCICMGDYWGSCPRHGDGGKAPLFSADMGQSWRVVERMRKKGNVVSIYVMESYRGVSVMIEDACHGPQYRMVAPTAAEAICKAALLAEFPH